ncbi:MAG: hypothetical protein WBQ94_04340 [Terracidiphilus sp.]
MSDERHFEYQVLAELAELKKRCHELFDQRQEELRLLRQIHELVSPRLASIAIQFATQPTGASDMSAVLGPVILTSVGQVATASVQGFDQLGNPMPATFTMPSVVYSIDDTAGAIVKTVDNGDGTATLTDVANGVANLTASVTSAEGLALTDTETVTVANPVVPPPTPVLSSIKIAFDTTPAAASAAARRK